MQPNQPHPTNPNHNTPRETNTQPQGFSSPAQIPPPTYQPQAPRNRRREGAKSILSTIFILISAPLVALLLIAFVFQSYEVDGPSMERTLSNNDRLIVVKVGKTWSRITGEDYIPDRGEIIVFAKLGTIDPVAGSERQLIKRVIGLPGDRVVVANGQITIFNDDHSEGFDPDERGDYEDQIASRGGATDIDISVPDGHVFVMGDNRSNSLDSRTFGIISSDEIIGRLSLRIFPLNEIERF